jgi:predicted nucleic acid-binding protein
VTESFWEEVLAGGASDPATQRLPNLNWARRADSVVVPSLIQAWDLGDGESEVLTFAFSNPASLAIIDDAAARHCARALKSL